MSFVDSEDLSPLISRAVQTDITGGGFPLFGVDVENKHRQIPLLTRSAASNVSTVHQDGRNSPFSASSFDNLDGVVQHIVHPSNALVTRISDKKGDKPRKSSLQFFSVFSVGHTVPASEIVVNEDFAKPQRQFERYIYFRRAIHRSFQTTCREKCFCCIICFLIAVLVLGILLWNGTFDIQKVTTFSNEVYPERNGSIVLLGDSLIRYPCDKNNLMGRIQAYSKYNNLGITNCGVGGNTIADIRGRLDDVLGNVLDVTQTTRPVSDARVNRNSSVLVILYWDSDCSNYDETYMNSREIKYLREAYAANVKYVLQRIFDVGAYAAISGPGVLLSKPWKEQMLNDYREINRNISRELMIDYIDMRSALLDSFAANIDPTYDGEHPNDVGADITARLFARQIDFWKSYSPKKTYSRRPIGTRSPAFTRFPTKVPTYRPSRTPTFLPTSTPSVSANPTTTAKPPSRVPTPVPTTPSRSTTLI